MSANPDIKAETLQSPSLVPARGPRRHGRRAVGLAIIGLVIAGVVVGVVDPFGGSAPSGSSALDNGAPTSTFTVAHENLSSETDVSGTLGYASSYSAINQAQGTITSLPSVGQVVSEGQVLYQVDGKPVMLLYGSIPAYRTLSEGMTGADVTELNAALVALGYATSAELDPTSDTFTSETAAALESLQGALGLDETGSLALGEAVFLPGAARVTQVSATLGSMAQPGQPVLTASSTTRQVSVALDATLQSHVAVGDKVTITLPNNQTTSGVVSSVGTVATTPSSGNNPSGNNTPTITVLITPTDAAATGTLDQASVEVAITTATADNALVVPINALMALAGGGYAVEEVESNGMHQLVPVNLGLFDDSAGLVQVSGSGLAAGQRIVVPSA